MGTPAAAMVGAALSFPIVVLPVLSAGWPLMLGFKGEPHVSFNVFLFSEVVGLSLEGFLRLGEPWIHLTVTGTL